MRYLGKWNVADPTERYQDRIRTSDYLRVRGTDRIPPAPRSVIAQSGPRGVLVSWQLPEKGFEVITGWRIYKGDESSLYAELHDRGSRQHFIETTAGATPPPVGIFVTSLNALGQESAPVQVIASATAEAGAPVMPAAGSGQTGTNTGGGGTGGNGGGGHTRTNQL